MKTISLLLIAALLAGCGSLYPTIQQVEVPVAVRPYEEKDIPKAPESEFAKTPATEPIDNQIRALLIDREVWAAYTLRLRGLVEACIK